MKIAVISDHIPSTKAHSINVAKHAQAFFELGHEVEILIVRRFRDDKNNLKIKNFHNFYAINHKIKFKSFRDYSPYYFREIRFIGPFLSKITNFITDFFSKFNIFLDPEKRISDYCKVNKFDFIYCRRTLKAAFYNVLNKIPTILDVHSNRMTTKKYELKNLIKLKEKKYFKGIVAIHKIFKKRIIDFGFSSKKILVMENAVNLDKFDKVKYNKLKLRRKLGLPLNKNLIMYSGSLNTKGRGIDTCLEAVKILNNQNFSFYFIGGNKKQIKYWKNFCIKEKIKTDVNFLRWIENALIPYYLKAADILLAPYSLKIPTLKFMSPLKIFEYMATNVPIIASNVKRIKEICNNNECLFFNADNSIDLTNKIELLIGNKELRKEITQNAYYKSRKYSFSIRCEKIIGLIK